MLVIKNSQLNDDVISVLNLLIDLDINASAAFKLTRIMKEISSIVEDKTKAEKKIMEKYGDKNEDGTYKTPIDQDGNPVENAVSIKDIDSFTKEMSELLEIENNIDYDKLDFEELGLTTIKVKDLLKIDFLFK